jgi:integrase
MDDQQPTKSPKRQHRRSEGSVTKKGGLWYAVLTIGRDQTGRHQTGRQARHWSKGFKTKRSAEHALAQLLIEGRQAKETTYDVESVIKAYIEHDVTSRGRRSPTTTQRYRGLLQNIQPMWKKRVDRLDGQEIEAFYMSLVDGGLSHTTVHHVHNLMFAAFRWARSSKRGLITRNPFDNDSVDKPHRAKSNAQSFTVAQAQRALEYLVATKHANALVFSLASACRRGETCGLKWSAVDLVRKVAIIRESRYQVRGDVGQKPTKADRIREVPLNNTALQALEAERIRQEQRRRFAGDAWVESGHVFTDEFGAPLSPMALTNAFSRCAKRAGLPTTRMHDLRHTAATFILSAGGNPSAATQILGHSEEGTTLRIYGHVIGLDSIRASKQIDRALASRSFSRSEPLKKKKPRKNEAQVVAPTGIEPVFAT